MEKILSVMQKSLLALGLSLIPGWAMADPHIPNWNGPGWYAATALGFTETLQSGPYETSAACTQATGLEQAPSEDRTSLSPGSKYCIYFDKAPYFS